MEQRKQVVRSFVSRGLRVSHAASIAGMPKSTYYYQSNGRPKGKKCSTFTINGQGEKVSNDMVIGEILDILAPEYHDYGYQVVASQLRRRGYKINPKKVYRLMKEHHILHPKTLRGKKINKQYVKRTTPQLESPFATVEADITYIYIHEQQRHAYLITFLCTFSRFAPVWEIDYSMKSTQVASLVRRFIQHPTVIYYLTKNGLKVKIRTDNGPQFAAKNLADELEKLHIDHEFIKPGTPQENGHIESFHWTLTRLVCNRNIFSSLDHIRKILNEFFYAYNYTRVMKSLLYHSPDEFLKLWNTGAFEVRKDHDNKERFFFRQKSSSLAEVDSCAEDRIGSFKNNTFNNPFLNPVENSPV